MLKLNLSTLLIFFLACTTQLLQFLTANIFSESILFEYQVIKNNIYYINGDIKNEYDYSTNKHGYSSYGQNYVIKSRTGYLNKYFSILLDYSYSINNINFFNQIESKIDIETLSRSVHYIQPLVFGIYDPFRIGISYLYNNNNSLKGEQLWSLVPGNSLSFYLQFYLSELWESSPIGLSTRYRIAFDPSLSLKQINSNLYHNLSFGFHINFNYYGQFEILFSYVLREGDFSILHLSSYSTSSTVHYRSTLKRYYTDFIYTFQILKEFSIMFGVGQLIYSEFESPMLRFVIGANYFVYN